MNILVIHGPNLNMLGKRDPTKYGNVTLPELHKMLTKVAKRKNATLKFFQSNHEGALIDFLQKDSSRECDGVIINPGALIRYGYSLRQALIDLAKPVVEVHMSEINKTGINKTVNVLDDVRVGQVTGLKEQSYIVGLEKILKAII